MFQSTDDVVVETMETDGSTYATIKGLHFLSTSGAVLNPKVYHRSRKKSNSDHYDIVVEDITATGLITESLINVTVTRSGGNIVVPFQIGCPRDGDYVT